MFCLVELNDGLDYSRFFLSNRHDEEPLDCYDGTGGRGLEGGERGSRGAASEGELGMEQKETE